MVTLFSLDDAALSRRLERLASLAWLPGALLEIVGGTLRLQRAARSSLNPPDAARLAGRTRGPSPGRALADRR
ncbi:MAG: hypothetical protein ACLU98_08325 [Desulfovibrio fairfieldensis]